MDDRADWQPIPVKVYCTADRVTIAAPMPGLEPEDIDVEVTADGKLTIHGDLRGRFKGDKDVLMNEWEVGGYHRELDLPRPVDAALANVTYGNGVLVVALPVADEMRAGNLFMARIGPSRGERVGSAGHPVAARSMTGHQLEAHGRSDVPQPPAEADAAGR